MDELSSAWLKLKVFVDEQACKRQHYLAFFEHAEAAYLVTDTRGKIEEVNGAAVDLFDRRRSYLTGKPLAALVFPDMRPEFRRRLQGLSGPAKWRSSFTAQGRRVDVMVSARPMPAERGIVWLLHPTE